MHEPSCNCLDSELRIDNLHSPLHGPIEDHGKFFIYKLLDERSSVNDAAIKNSIEVARQMLLVKEKRAAVNRYIAGMAELDNVRVLGGNVLSLEVTPFQMLTYRLIGFGGKILAVPQLYPRAGWMKYFREHIRPPQP